MAVRNYAFNIAETNPLLSRCYGTQACKDDDSITVAKQGLRVLLLHNAPDKMLRFQKDSHSDFYSSYLVRDHSFTQTG